MLLTSHLFFSATKFLEIIMTLGTSVTKMKISQFPDRNTEEERARKRTTTQYHFLFSRSVEELTVTLFAITNPNEIIPKKPN